MNKVTSIDEIKNFIKSNKLALLYVSSAECTVCHALLPKIKEILTRYPKIVSNRVDVGEIREIAGEFSIFTVPVVIFYVDGKEILRRGRFISIGELEENIDRYYRIIEG